MTGPPWDQPGADPAGDVAEFLDAAERLGRVRRCECCDLPIESCGREAERRQRAEANAERERLLASGWFEAKWSGKCVACGTGFGPGELIRRSDPTLGFIASCCAP